MKPRSRAAEKLVIGGRKQSCDKTADLEAEIARLRLGADRAAALIRELRAAEAVIEDMRAAIGNLAEKFGAKHIAPAAGGITPVLEDVAASPSGPTAPPVTSSVQPAPSTDRRSTGEQEILDALANLEAVGVAQPSKRLLAAFAGYYSPGSVEFAAPAASLARQDLIRFGGVSASLTDAGRAAAIKPARPATTRELQERIASVLGNSERKLLALLIEAYPESLRRVELAARAGYSNAQSGGFAAPLARLVGLGYAEAVRSGVVRGSDVLFLEKRR